MYQTWIYMITKNIQQNVHPVQCVIYLFYGLNCVPFKFLCWSPHPQCDIFGNRTFTEVTKVKWGHEEGCHKAIWLPFLIRGGRDIVGCAQRERHLMSYLEEEMPANQEENPQEKTKSAGTSILGLLAPRTVRNKFLLLKPPSLYLLW